MLRKTLVLTLITVIVIILLPIPEVAVADVTLEGDTYHCEYKWEYKNSKWTYTARIAKWDYDDYHSIPVEQRKNYGFMVTTLDPEVKEIGNKLHELAAKEGYSSYDEASFVLAFVQSLRYTPDILTGYDEYPRFPVETLVDDGGDCEDTAILYATLIRIIG